MGDFVSAEACFNAIKGMRTLSTRLEKHQENSLKVFEYLEKKKLVKEIYFLPDKKNIHHKLWKKYFNLSNGLITFSVTKTNQIESFIDRLNFFKIGFSWGGYESLILPLNEIKPSLKNYKKSVYWFRIHIGLESADDLIKDLERGFKNYEKK